MTWTVNFLHHEMYQNFSCLEFPFTLCARGSLTKEKEAEQHEWRVERRERERERDGGGEEVTGGTDDRRKEALGILMN